MPVLRGGPWPCPRTADVGFAIDAKRFATQSDRPWAGIRETAWTAAIDLPGAQVAVTHYCLAWWPTSTRLLIRRVRLDPSWASRLRVRHMGTWRRAWREGLTRNPAAFSAVFLPPLKPRPSHRTRFPSLLHHESQAQVTAQDAG